jgi:hypothetical protein
MSTNRHSRNSAIDTEYEGGPRWIREVVYTKREVFDPQRRSSD